MEMRKREVFYIRRRVIVVVGVSIWGRWRRVEKERKKRIWKRGGCGVTLVNNERLILFFFLFSKQNFFSSFGYSLVSTA